MPPHGGAEVRHKAVLSEALSGRRAACLICQRRCVLDDGERGWCGTRINDGGSIYCLTYAEVSSLLVNPIEKNPVFHFAPGSRWLTIGSLGCNFRCPQCSNSAVSHWTNGPMPTRLVQPGEVVEQAMAKGCFGITWAYNEPALWFEYTMDTATMAKQLGLCTNFVTNGYLTPEAISLIAPELDVYRVHIRGFSSRSYENIAHIKDFMGILEVAGRARKSGLHIEVVTTLIPGINDDPGELRELAAWIEEELGPQTPWHVNRFIPASEAAEMQPTPLDTLELVHEIGVDQGLWYVYVGNLPGSPWENTYCHVCGEQLVERYNVDLFDIRIVDARCPECNARIPGHFPES
jgi:pyruvate formate lyase activating enzyme